MRFLLVLALAACSSSSSPQPATQPAVPAPPTPKEAPPVTPPAAGTSAPGVGQTCGSADECAPGLECIKFYGIAGPRGPQFKSCEIRCGADKMCPTGTACKTVADGPGQVCR
jgi:hypothetical protein